MGPEAYLVQLTLRLAEGMARLPEQTRSRHADWVRALQNPDGGWSGREGGSDLYYTGFALRSLAVLDVLTADICQKTAGFLSARLAGQASVVDFFSFLYSCFLVQAAGGPDVLASAPADWPRRVADTLESFRTADGGYGKSTDSASGSTYHTFLVGLSYELLGDPLPRPENVARFLGARRRDDGGFVEIAPMRRGGTNPTAAAVGILQVLRSQESGVRGQKSEVRGQRSEVGGSETSEGSEPPPSLPTLSFYRQGLIAFLLDMVSEEGGMKANARAPLADLLSTFTGTWTLAQLDGLDRLDRVAVRGYVESLEQPTGGFHGALWDEHSDVEYTFYGLGCLALHAKQET